MNVLFVNEALVHQLLPMRACIESMRTALTNFSRGDAVQPLRSLVRLPDGTGVLGLMPGQDRPGGDRVRACRCQVLDGNIKMHLHLLIARAGGVTLGAAS